MELRYICAFSCLSPFDLLPCDNCVIAAFFFPQVLVMHVQGLVVGADISSQRIIVLFDGEGSEDGKEIALKPENVKM
jgi:hypothetical protein